MKSSTGHVTLFYKALTVLDAATLDPLQGLMGQSWYVDVGLTGTTDDESVVADFSKIKNKIKKIIDEKIDHRLILDSQLVQVLGSVGKLDYRFGSNQVYEIQYQAPLEAYCLLPFGYDEKSLETYIATVVKNEMPENIKQVEIILRGENFSEMFHYTHGLKQHYGNCQRLFHGHKNTIEIWKNGSRDHNWEKQLSQSVFKGNIHFAFWENVINKSSLINLFSQNDQFAPEGIISGDAIVELEYTSGQGKYSAKLPSQQVFFMPCETTVENIAMFFASWIKRSWASPTDKIMVVAYEGIAKGAKAIAH
jgi:6-pyruvoyl-tetrahydropterin synthase